MDTSHIHTDENQQLLNVSYPTLPNELEISQQERNLNPFGLEEQASKQSSGVKNESVFSISSSSSLDETNTGTINTRNFSSKISTQPSKSVVPFQNYSSSPKRKHFTRNESQSQNTGHNSMQNFIADPDFQKFIEQEYQKFDMLRRMSQSVTQQSFEQQDKGRHSVRKS